MTVEQPVNYNTTQDFKQINDAIYGDDKIHAKDFIIGALVGGIVGAATALLLAPKAGSELRSDVAIQAVTLKDKGIELSGTAKEKTVQLSSQLKEQSTTIVEKVKSKTAKQAPILDDGTVSSEGEEPLGNEYEAIIDGIAEEEAAQVTQADVANSTRHTDVE
ncbi:YtxH domain-containing protein [Solibacillus sp. MA9]|uniref:YtxH domain-containing protein n=1 Tax=Solibacillus palustris TaxID=2908203 RepID=A0ABS9UDL7_9BACL|nr:YtxH domain-containing protein [Solibacillus sp. MA9]MCH7322437.1 YtxH domain-containing protein [Solibacillus sp. MA9]